MDNRDRLNDLESRVSRLERALANGQRAKAHGVDESIGHKVIAFLTNNVFFSDEAKTPFCEVFNRFEAIFPGVSKKGFSMALVRLSDGKVKRYRTSKAWYFLGISLSPF